MLSELLTKAEFEALLRYRLFFKEQILNSLNNGDIIILHCPWDLVFFDDYHNKPVILYEHRAVRPYTFMFKHIIRYVEPIRASIIRRDRKWILKKYKELFQKADLILVNSKFIQSQMRKWFGIETHVLYPPIDLNVFRPAKNPSRDYFLSVQRINWQKRVELQIMAFKKLKEDLIIVGGPQDIEPNPDLIELARDSPNIQVLGGVKRRELVKLMANAKAVIQTGYYEDFGLVPIQAFACGTPVIVVDEGGFKETVNSPELGVRIKPPYLRNLRKTVENFNYSKFSQLRLRTEAKKYGIARFNKQMEKYIELAVKIHESRNKRLHN